MLVQNTESAKREWSKEWLLWGVGWLIWTALFWKPWMDWFGYVRTEDLYSHGLLIPLISGYLIWIRRGEWGAVGRAMEEGDGKGGGVFAGTQWGWVGWLGWGLGLLGLAIAGMGLVLEGRRSEWGENDRLFFAILGYGIGWIGLTIGLLGWERVKRYAFAICFLGFMVPLPTWAVDGMTTFFQYASADVSYLFLKWSQTPVFRDGLFFQLPGLTIEVAEACSGIRSSLVLGIVGILGGYLFLKQPRHRVILFLSVIVIGIVRNAVRIVTLALMTVHVDPTVIEGAIHDRGGPYFFALSLVPFFGVLMGLRVWEGYQRKNLRERAA